MSEVNEITLGPQSFHPQTRIEQFEVVTSLLTELAERLSQQSENGRQVVENLVAYNQRMVSIEAAVERIGREFSIAHDKSNNISVAVARVEYKLMHVLERLPTTQPVAITDTKLDSSKKKRRR